MARYRAVGAGLVLAVAISAPRPAHADLTVFTGSTSAPARRPAFGVALGLGLTILGVEVEYSASPEKADTGAPGVTTGSFNLLVQTPRIGRFQFYATTGAGGYQERFLGERVLGVATNVGGGVKLTLAGPARIRLDYRIFKLSGGAIASTPQRAYAGLNIAF